MPVIGFLHSASREPSISFVAELRRGLEEGAGLVEGRNIAIEYRWAQGEYERLPALAAEPFSPAHDHRRRWTAIRCRGEGCDINDTGCFYER